MDQQDSERGQKSTAAGGGGWHIIIAIPTLGVDESVRWGYILLHFTQRNNFDVIGVEMQKKELFMKPEPEVILLSLIIHREILLKYEYFI